MSVVTTEDLEGYLLMVEQREDKYGALDYLIATEPIIQLLEFMKSKEV